MQWSVYQFMSRYHYLLLLIGLMEVSSHRIVGDVEGMVPGGHVWIVPALYDEGVLAPAHNIDLRNEQTVDVPRNTPSHVTYTEGDDIYYC